MSLLAIESSSTTMETAAPDFTPPRAFATLKCNNPLNLLSNEQVFHIVGTAHICEGSCEDVRQVIRSVQPEVIFLELCSERRPILHLKSIKFLTLQEALQEWRAGRSSLFQALYSWYLGQNAALMETFPGEEFRVACTEAAKIGAKVVLGDRPLQVTLARLWMGMGWWDKCRLVGMLLWDGLKLPDKEEMQKLLDELKETDALIAAIEALGQSLPLLRHTLITERDQYMVYMMRKLSEHATRVVAVVGAGHLPGIRACWEQEIDIEEIRRMPEKRKRSHWPLVSMLSLAAGGLVVVGVVVRCRRR